MPSKTELPSFLVEAELDEPILFRTTNEEVYKRTLSTGSLWLRSDKYYRDLEDKNRNDRSEGGSSGTTALPLMMHMKNGTPVHIKGEGEIGQFIGPHYLVSMHGTSISQSQRKAFGGFTFGIRSLSRLAAEVLFQASQSIKCGGYRYGQICYQYSAFAQSLHSSGGAALRIGGNPTCYLNPADTDVLRKRPIQPFIEQDEWRIVIFTDGYIDSEPMLPLKINMSTPHFYPYIGGELGD